jgi:GNAT superfamily N-acetyltransferase
MPIRPEEVANPNKKLSMQERIATIEQIDWQAEAEPNGPDIGDSQVLYSLGDTHGKPGVSRFNKDSFIWCDKKGIARGVLTLVPAWLEAEPPIYGFTIVVHHKWRRRGVATKLYRAASASYRFYEEDFGPMGAAWARSLAKRRN